ncbi:TPA: PKD domain-containing protein [Thermoplasmata archaeon]|nr:PKD domain-containing protein [Thermoplasmata archaeon]
MSVIAAMIMASLVGVVGVTSLAGNAAAVDEDVVREFRVGVVDMPVSTLNPNVYTTSAEWMAIMPCYSTLIQYDVDGELIGDIARSWSSSPDGLVWEFTLVENAYFVDPQVPTSTDHPLTSEDVIFTYYSIIMEPGSVFNYYLSGVVSNMWVAGPYQFGIELYQPYAPFLSALANIPILPEYIWEGQSLTQFDNSPPIGSGPFFYATDGLPDAGVVQLWKNPLWHMIDLHGWSPRVDKWILVREYDAGTAYLDLTLGNVDMVLNVPPSAYVNNIPENPDVIGISQSSGFVYELNLNQMSDEMRVSLGGAFNAGESNQLLLDPVIKTAFSMCVDKEEFVDDVLAGLGSPADSLLPSSSPWHYTYPTPIQFDPEGARELLWDAGWRYDAAMNYYDKYDPTQWADFMSVCPIYDSPDLQTRDALSFRFCTLDTSVEWLIGSYRIVGWCEDAGIELNLEIMSVNEMNAAWYAADYDVWLWDWIFDPLADPSVDILSVMTTDSIGTLSDCFYSNVVYDQLYADSLVEMDPDARGLILDEMQAMLYEDRSCQCVAYRDSLNAMYTGTWASESDLSSRYMLLPEVSNTWISIDLYPVDNPAPIIAGVDVSWDTSTGVAEVGEPVTFVATGMDDDPFTILEYKFIWGDGTCTGWSPSVTASHAYAESGEYVVDVVVREASASNGFLDNFMNSVQVDVQIYDMSNLPPKDLSIVYSPVNITAGAVVTFQGAAIDPDGDQMYYSWDFGDGTDAEGQTVDHEYVEDGPYVVTLYVTDNVLGNGPRPSSYQVLVAVGVNHAPYLVVPDFPEILAKTPTEFAVLAYDLDANDVLTFVWDWGDGTASVTDVAVASHEYRHKGEYVITVTLDDGTGLPGHVVSDTGFVTVLSLGYGNQHGGTKG